MSGERNFLLEDSISVKQAIITPSAYSFSPQVMNLLEGSLIDHIDCLVEPLSEVVKCSKWICPHVYQSPLPGLDCTDC